MKEEHIVYSVVLTGLIILLVPLGFTFELYQVGLGIVVAMIAALGLFYTQESRLNIAVLTLLLTFPLWWWLADILTEEIIVASIAFYITTIFFLATTYDQIKVERESVKEQSVPGMYIAVAVIGFFIAWFGPLEVDRIHAIILGIGLGLMFAYLFKNIGVKFAMPTLVLVAAIPFIGVLWFSDLIWTELINTSLTIAIWSSLGAYAVLRR